MLKKYYEQELGYLKDLSAEFAKLHPAIAPMLSSTTSDPDVERLLEGVAYLIGEVRQKLDDDLPEFIQGLTQIYFPHYLRPVPSCTIVMFGPKGALGEPALVPKGTELASVPVDGTKCVFSTCFDVTVHPASVVSAKLEHKAGDSQKITLAMKLDGTNLSVWRPDYLRFYLGGEYFQACDLLHLLMEDVVELRLTAPGEPVQILPASALRMAGFDKENSLLPYPRQAYQGYRLLQEYLILPEKYLFVDIAGLKEWHTKGKATTFNIELILKDTVKTLPEIRTDKFVLNATPAINLFKHDADPINLNHKKVEYRVVPSNPGKPGHYQVYRINQVTGYRQGSAQKTTYVPFEMFQYSTQETTTYHTTVRKSSVTEGVENYIYIGYESGAELQAQETLSIDLTCTNGQLPEGLQMGDVSQPTATSPERLTFKNITPTTPFILPPMDELLLWRLLSHMSLNYLSIATADNLKALLTLYLFTDSRDQTKTAANRRRIDGVQELSSMSEDRIVNGIIMRGKSIRLKCRKDFFASIGDMYIFGSVLNRFLATYASVNSFTRFEMEESITGMVTKWKVMLGDKPLI